MANNEDATTGKEELRGQVALVTGGGRGLGRAYALALAQAGMAVAVTARSEAEIQDTVREIEQGGGRGLAYAADVTDAKAMAQMIPEIEQELGAISLLINNAGIARAAALIAEVGEDEWWREIEVNLRGPFLFARAVLPSMIARGGGRIINLASRAGLVVIECGSAYCISKSALIRLTQFIDAENRAHGISVFAIHPGTVRTPMNDYLRTAKIVGQRAPHIQQSFVKLYEEGTDTPLEKSVNLVLSLASGQADVLSGRYISVTDDLDEMVRRASEIQQGNLYTLQLHKLDEA